MPKTKSKNVKAKKKRREELLTRLQELDFPPADDKPEIFKEYMEIQEALSKI